MTFVFNDSLNPYLIHPMISFTFNPDQTFSGSILTAVPDRYKKNNSLDTWTLQLKDSNFQDSIILYHID